MLSYQHGYHAGNFADVHKHLVFSLALDYLVRKPAAITVLDVYAGAGIYRLDSAQARKTGEAAGGIQRLWGAQWPDQAQPYRQAIEAANQPGQGLRWYPGSPVLATHWLRPGDAQLLCELHPQELASLKAAMRVAPDTVAQVHERDALEAMSGLTPPTIRRGCVLVDPSYEQADEYGQVARAVGRGIDRWPEASWLVWYPLLPGAPHRTLLRMLAGAGKRGELRSELTVRQPGAGMHGSGMLVVNPPWQLAEQLRATASWLEELGQNGPARLTIFS